MDSIFHHIKSKFNFVRGDNNYVNYGVINGLVEDDINQMLKTQCNGIISIIKDLEHKCGENLRNGIENIIAGKINALVSDIQLSGKASEDAIESQLTRNFNSLKREQIAEFSNIQNSLISLQNSKEELDRYVRTTYLEVSRQSAENTRLLIDIQLALNDEKDLQEKTLSEVLRNSVTLNLIKESVTSGKEKLQNLINNTKEGFAQLENLINEFAQTIQNSVADAVERSTPSSYNDILYEREAARRMVDEHYESILNEIGDSTDPEHIKNILLFYHIDFKKLHDEHREIVNGIESLKAFMHPRFRNGVDCIRCGTPKGLSYHCAICHFKGEEASKKQQTESLWQWKFKENSPHYKPLNDLKLLMISTDDFIGREIALADKFNFREYRHIESIIIDDAVVKISLEKSDRTSCSRSQIYEIFPNLKNFVLKKPKNGNAQYVLGENLFYGCRENIIAGKLKLYGMQYVKDIEAHCFAECGITEDNHDSFLENNNFSPELHKTLSAKPNKALWRS